jgi:hypothetical protein
LLGPSIEKWIVGDHDRAGSQLDQSCESVIDFVIVAHKERLVAASLEPGGGVSAVARDAGGLAPSVMIGTNAGGSPPLTTTSSAVL